MIDTKLVVPPQEGLYIKDFITSNEAAEIRDWAYVCIKAGLLPISKYIDVGSLKNRFSSRVNRLSPPELFGRIKERVESRFNTKEFLEDDYIGFSLMYHTKGAEILEHLDITNPGVNVLRINIMIKKPTEGGMPIILGKETNIQEGDLWSFVGDLSIHGCSMSDSDRVVLSFGYEINSKENR